MKSIIAIMGPSGVGKNTLGDLLEQRNHFAIPIHTTTRLKRKDDKLGFYRYLSHEEYRNLEENHQFLITSGDGPVVKPEYGNFYGILLEDCLQAWQQNSTIILFVSYKDIERLIQLKKEGYSIQIVNLTYTNIELGMKDRLINNCERDHSALDIHNRIQSALKDQEKYGEIIKRCVDSIIYTDQLDIEHTYQQVCIDLGIKSKMK